MGIDRFLKEEPALATIPSIPLAPSSPQNGGIGRSTIERSRSFASSVHPAIGGQRVSFHSPVSSTSRTSALVGPSCLAAGAARGASNPGSPWCRCRKRFEECPTVVLYVAFECKQKVGVRRVPSCALNADLYLTAHGCAQDSTPSRPGLWPASIYHRGHCLAARQAHCPPALARLRARLDRTHPEVPAWRRGALATWTSSGTGSCASPKGGHLPHRQQPS